MSNTKRNLLNENAIRRFMKLAEIDKLSDGFVTGLVQEVAEPFDGEEEDFDGESGLEMDMEEPEAEAPPADTALATEIASGVAAVLEDALGVSIQVEGDDAPEEAPADDVLDVDLEDEVPMALEEGQRHHAQAQMLHQENLRRQAVYQESLRRQAIHQESLRRAAVHRQALKDEVLRRVTSRLQQENRKDAVADQLSERILKRIKNQSKK